MVALEAIGKSHRTAEKFNLRLHPSIRGKWMTKPYLEPEPEFFDRSSVPKEIADLMDEWPEIDASTARLVRAAVSSRSPRHMRLAWEILARRAELAQTMRLSGSPRY
jgi:hypothetical protein